ncbi:MAG: NUMOD3 domain-containing DNA-binding protein [Nanoarchaeota archaeon]
MTKGILISGIYKITNPNGKIYIGKSKNVNKRFLSYKNKGCKGQTKLYNSFEKYGVENHKFEIIHVCAECDLNKFEIYYIEKFKCFNSVNGLNLRKGGQGGSASDETRKKMSAWQVGKKHSEQTRKRISASLTGLKLSEETKNKIRQAGSGEKNCWFGKKIAHLIESNRLRQGEKRSDETKKKQSEIKTGVKNSFFGKKHTQESLIKMRKSHSNISTETRQKISNSRLGKKMTKETKQKISDSLNKTYKIKKDARI